MRSYYSQVGWGLGQGRPGQHPPALRLKSGVDEEEEAGEQLSLAGLGGQGQVAGGREGAGGARHVQGQLLGQG